MGFLSTRLATSDDAAEAVAILRRSITQLCVADHQNDEETLEKWLRNKTPQHFDSWCADNDSRLLVAEVDTILAGVGALHRSGEIRLCYVSPAFLRAGVGTALVLAIEAQARMEPRSADPAEHADGPRVLREQRLRGRR